MSNVKLNVDDAQPSSSKASIEEDEKLRRLESLYKQLDIDGDGKIDIKDLSQALSKQRPHDAPPERHKFAMQIMEKADVTKDQSIDFKEFVNYVLENEKKLAIVFKDLDRNSDGYVDVKEIKNYLGELGLPTTDAEAERIIKKMNFDGNATVDLDAFQEYHMFYPSIDPLDIARSWRHSLIIDIGEDTLVPDDFTEKELESGSWWRHLVAGGCAGAVSRTATAPFDRLKIFLQVHASRQNGLRVVTGLKFLLKEGGLKSLWRGNGINVIKIAPETAFKFMFYEKIKKTLKHNHGNELSIFERFFAGSSAGVISQTLIYPMEVLKVRLALRKTGEMNRGIFDAARVIFKHEGSRAFYRGYLPNLLGIIPYAGIDLAIYETLKKFYVSQCASQKEPNIFVLLACGTTSSICGQLSSYPLALIRTKLQAHAFTTNAGTVHAQPDTMVGQFRYIIQNEGVTGLYRGLTPNFMKVLPAVGISYVVYEKTRKHLGVTMS